MKRFVFACGALAVLSACVTPETTTPSASRAPATAAAAPTTEPVTREKVERCWKSAGLRGDIYKFLTPDEAKGIQKVGGASDGQMAAFRSCLAR